MVPVFKALLIVANRVKLSTKHCNYELLRCVCPRPAWFDTLPKPQLECHPDERSLSKSLSTRTGRLYTCVVHAPGWSLYGRVSFPACKTLDAGPLQDTRTSCPSHPPADRPFSP